MFGKAFLAATAFVAVTAPANAAVNLVTNGSFEQSSFSVNSNYAGFEFSVQSGNSTAVTGWSATGPDANEQGINFYYNDVASATTKTIFNRYGDQNAKLATSFTGSSPDGGNFVGFDSDHVGDGAGAYNANFGQVITGLDTSKTYTLKFYWAATQLQNRHGPTTDRYIYSLGGDTRTTATFALPDQGFVGWKTVYAKFSPTSSTETLNFMAFGTPAGLPPFVLLDGVSLSVPEPAQWALMLLGFGAMGMASRRRRRSTTVYA
ncbi:PEPxxWA-CTERM sorting domain-containing protein [Sphingomonas antarctica]|uniref:PEPxxWA-CTERM sorting domain-containing protein n=1 Tax=Sphingomonas antarctica TaxID=2040274 RepID=UPI0039E77150